MTANLTDVVDLISAAIEAEPDHDKRAKLRAARELVRDVVWGTDIAPMPDWPAPHPSYQSALERPDWERVEDVPVRETTTP